MINILSEGKLAFSKLTFILNEYMHEESVPIPQRYYDFWYILHPAEVEASLQERLRRLVR